MKKAISRCAISKYLDIHIDSIEERKKIVNNCIQKGYDDEYSLERMANYLSNCPEVEQTEYNVVCKRTLEDRQIKKELPMYSTTFGKDEDGKSIRLVDVLSKDSISKSKYKKLKAEDDEEDVDNPTLESLYEQKDIINNQLQENEIDSKTYAILFKQINDIGAQINMILDSDKPKVKSFKITKQPNKTDFTNLDYTNTEHVKALLLIDKTNVDDLGVVDLLIDRENLLNQIKITDKQKQILKLLQQQYTEEEIANILNCSHQYVSKVFNQIVKKIINTGCKK